MRSSLPPFVAPRVNSQSADGAGFRCSARGGPLRLSPTFNDPEMAKAKQFFLILEHSIACSSYHDEIIGPMHRRMERAMTLVLEQKVDRGS